MYGIGEFVQESQKVCFGSEIKCEVEIITENRPCEGECQIDGEGEKDNIIVQFKSTKNMKPNSEPRSNNYD